jgi:RNase P subunit RPR2
MANKKIKRFWCDVCDYPSYSRANLEKHSNAVHLGKKDFKCDICDQAFSIKGNFKNHVNSVHNNLTRYSCDLCDFSSYYRIIELI